MNVIRLGKRGKQSVSLGFCEKTKKVAFIAIGDLKKPMTMETMKILMVQNVSTTNSRCEDGEYCWNLECPLNHTKPEAMTRYLGKKYVSEENLKEMSASIQKYGENLVSEIKDWDTPSIIRFKKAPIIVWEKKK